MLLFSANGVLAGIYFCQKSCDFAVSCDFRSRVAWCFSGSGFRSITQHERVELHEQRMSVMCRWQNEASPYLEMSICCEREERV